jgi:hypothetical protein
LACSHATEPSTCGDARSLDPALRLPAATTNTIDDQWATLARQVPGGWGGFFLDSVSQPTVYLVHPQRRQEALGALHADGVGLPLYDIRTSQVWQGRWDFAQLYDWYRYVNVRAWAVNGLYWTDIDEAHNRLAYGVDTTAKGELEALFVTLDLPCDLVTVTVSAPVTALSPGLPNPAFAAGGRYK